MEKMNLDQALIELASEHSIRNKEAIDQSDLAGCYYCLAIFEPTEIIEYIDESLTAICPKCGIDSVLANASPYKLEEDTLRKLNKYWF